MPETHSIEIEALMAMANFKLCSFAGSPAHTTSGWNSSSVFPRATEIGQSAIEY